MYPTPAYLRKTIHLMVGLTILAWATQLLFASWARGAELPAAGGRVQYAQLPVELGIQESLVGFLLRERSRSLHPANGRMRRAAFGREREQGDSGTGAEQLFGELRG